MPSKPIRLTYEQSSLSSENAQAPSGFPRSTEQYSDKKDLPTRMLAVQIGSALASDYVASSASSYQFAPRRKPVPGSKSDPPPLPPKQNKLPNSEGDLPSHSGNVSPFADPKFEPPPILRPGVINVRQSIHKMR
jgi:hypothetical protein